MITTVSLMALAPVGRRAATGALQSFMAGGTGLSGVGVESGEQGHLGIIPLIVAGVSAAGSMYAAKEQAGAAEGAATAGAEWAAKAAIAPYRYEFKAVKRQIAAQRLDMVFDAVTGQSVPKTTDSSSTWLFAAIGVAVVIGVVLVVKGV